MRGSRASGVLLGQAARPDDARRQEVANRVVFSTPGTLSALASSSLHFRSFRVASRLPRKDLGALL